MWWIGSSSCIRINMTWQQSSSSTIYGHLCGIMHMFGLSRTFDHLHSVEAHCGQMAVFRGVSKGFRDSDGLTLDVYRGHYDILKQ